jgi:cell division protein FtsB
MANKFFKFSFILVIILTVLLVVSNYSTREYVHKLIKIYKLKKEIEKTKLYNISLEKRLSNLQTKPKELEKAVKMELGYVAEDEILYKFNNSDSKNTKDNK